jgi:PAS domain-containing protein
VQQFILEENLARFQRLLKTEPQRQTRLMLRGLILSTQRELALLNSAAFGAGRRFASAAQGDGVLRDKAAAARLRRDFETSARPYVLLDPRPGLHIVDINAAYAKATMTRARDIAGRPLFEVFPDNPDDPEADGVCNLLGSLATAAETRRAHAMAIQRYDIRDGEHRFVERYWRPVNTPLFDHEGRLLFLLHHVEDVTGERLAPSNCVDETSPSDLTSSQPWPAL